MLLFHHHISYLIYKTGSTCCFFFFLQKYSDLITAVKQQFNNLEFLFSNTGVYCPKSKYIT